MKNKSKIFTEPRTVSYFEFKFDKPFNTNERSKTEFKDALEDI